jgi:hypothetical protein
VPGQKLLHTDPHVNVYSFSQFNALGDSSRNWYATGDDVSKSLTVFAWSRECQILEQLPQQRSITTMAGAVDLGAGMTLKGSLRLLRISSDITD